MNSAAPPEALLFITPDCPHCATVKRGLEELERQGLIGSVTVVDATVQPDLAAIHGVRAAPWLQLGPFTLTGTYSAAELRQWAAWAQNGEGMAHYVAHLLHAGGYAQARAFIHADTRRLQPLLAIVADPSADLVVRLGVSALLESYAGSPALQALLPQLAALSRHADHRVRADVCHLLGLTGDAAARIVLDALLKDENAEVREIAQEALARSG
ncbi:MAG: hypothetical protein Fur0026_01060 [Sideroxydans sp.]